MDTAKLEELIAEGETFTVEFKAGRINDAELVEAVACLANGSGGVLLVGVSDRGEVTGVPPRRGGTTEPARIAALLANRTEPSIMTTVEVTALDGHTVLVVHVPACNGLIHEYRQAA